MRRVSRALDVVYLACAWIAGLLMITLCALVVWSILARLIGVFAGGANDFAGYVMAASTFLALAYTFRSGGHIRVALVLDNLPAAPRRIALTLCLAIIAGLTLYLAYHMTADAYISWDFGEISEGADETPLWIPKSFVAVGAWMFALAAVHSFLEAVFDYRSLQAAAAASEGPSEV